MSTFLDKVQISWREQKRVQQTEQWLVRTVRNFLEFLFDVILFPIMKRVHWIPSSRKHLAEAEDRLMSYIDKPYASWYVDIGRMGNSSDTCRIYTMRMLSDDKTAKRLPLVLLHGLGCGAPMWILNLPELSKTRDVYAIDLLGFGRSSRPDLSADAWLAEMQMVFSIEEWRRHIGLERFVLTGHSLGGFLASSYAIKHPTRVAHLILEDPWGLPEFNPDRPLGKRMPSWGKIVQSTLNHMNVLASVRMLGPLGPKVMEISLASGAEQYFKDVVSDRTVVPNYIYHCNARKPSGEALFKNLSVHFGWTKYPMVYRLSNLDPQVPISFIYGSLTFITKKPAFKIRDERKGSYVDIQIIKESGHNIHMEKPAEFNAKVNAICDQADREEANFSGERHHAEVEVDYRL
ncbi:1-acylglycerol-3-phosphate O-acyltransferase ABHD5 [Galendromus occidentalis]|uniref:1-acylglycerol-3-phosphate O-acyltransferase ABHD5 n=1 Tax=Galendromus occidentalis TaxID=34638 RepID=A0AAJ6VYJ7_9ACAR|nr:1-acylglycerol-3-phosphate O-acyltransferase ABHD5 [Galendromus occidentalis]